MSDIKKNVLVSFKEYLLIIVGLVSYVLGWVIFLIPNNLVGGGVTGISSIIQYATGIPIGYSYFVLNLVLLIAALAIYNRPFQDPKR